MLQCVTVYCSVLQCIAVCHRVLQRVLLQKDQHGVARMGEIMKEIVKEIMREIMKEIMKEEPVAVYYIVLQCVATCCSVLQCATTKRSMWCSSSGRDERGVCCSVLQCVAVCCSVLQCHTATHCNTLQHLQCVAM